MELGSIRFAPFFTKIPAPAELENQETGYINVKGKILRGQILLTEIDKYHGSAMPTGSQSFPLIKGKSKLLGKLKTEIRSQD